jgi:hypothetical protein
MLYDLLLDMIVEASEKLRLDWLRRSLLLGKFYDLSALICHDHYSFWIKRIQVHHKRKQLGFRNTWKVTKRRF